MSQLEHLVKFTSGKSLSDSKRRLLGLIKEPYVWAADPRGFNDPFEFKVPVQWSDEDTHLRARYFADNPIGDEPAFLAWKRGLTRNFKWAYAMNTRAALLDSLGVCCFTRRVQNQLFWSHYANSHTGWAAEFVLDPAQLPFVAFAQPVEYSRSLQHWPIQNPLVELARLTFFAKSSAWSYENEYRIVFNETGRISVPKAALRAIYLGCRMDRSLKAAAIKSAKRHGVKIWEMCEAHDKYGLCRVAPKDGVTVMSSFF